MRCITEVTDLDSCIVEVFGRTDNVLQFDITVNKAKQMTVSYPIEELGHHFFSRTLFAVKIKFCLILE